jgi:hypothetical protein
MYESMKREKGEGEAGGQYEVSGMSMKENVDVKTKKGRQVCVDGG